MFIVIIYNGIVIAKNSDNLYLCYVSIGIISLFAIQVMINLGVVVGLFPVTGVTLPFISYGGSSLLTCFISIAVLEACATKRADNEMEAIELEKE